MKKDFEGTRYVYYKDTRTGRVSEMNFWEWVRVFGWNENSKDWKDGDPFTFPDMNRKKSKEYLEYIRLVDLDSPLNQKPERLTVEEDPLECPLCGYIAETDGRLQLHKEKVHG